MKPENSNSCVSNKSLPIPNVMVRTVVKIVNNASQSKQPTVNKDSFLQMQNVKTS